MVVDFPAPFRTDEPGDATAGHLERQVVDGDPLAVLPGEA
jgi:hypothetical protein